MRLGLGVDLALWALVNASVNTSTIHVANIRKVRGTHHLPSNENFLFEFRHIHRPGT